MSIVNDGRQSRAAFKFFGAALALAVLIVSLITSGENRNDADREASGSEESMVESDDNIAENNPELFADQHDMSEPRSSTDAALDQSERNTSEEISDSEQDAITDAAESQAVDMEKDLDANSTNNRVTDP